MVKIKREIKYTKIKELEVQLNSFVNETIRLKQILDSQSHQMDQYQIKYREYSDLEDRYYQQSNIIEELRKDNLELSEAIKIVEEQNRDLITNLKRVQDINQKKSTDQKNDPWRKTTHRSNPPDDL